MNIDCHSFRQEAELSARDDQYCAINNASEYYLRGIDAVTAEKLERSKEERKENFIAGIF